MLFSLCAEREIFVIQYISFRYPNIFFCNFLDKCCLSTASLPHNQNLSFKFSVVPVSAIHCPSSTKSLVFLNIRCLLLTKFSFWSIKNSQPCLWVSHHILIIFCFAFALYFFSLAVPLFYPKNMSFFWPWFFLNIPVLLRVDETKVGRLLCLKFVSETILLA